MFCGDGHAINKDNFFYSVPLHAESQAVLKIKKRTPQWTIVKIISLSSFFSLSMSRGDAKSFMDHEDNLAPNTHPVASRELKALVKQQTVCDSNTANRLKAQLQDSYRSNPHTNARL